MERKDLLEKLQEGLVKQFDALGEEFGVEGKDAALAIARIDTANTIMEIQDKLEPFEPIEMVAPLKFTLHNVSTKELVEELTKREGVKRSDLGPDMEEQSLRTGPTIILEIID